MSEIKYEPFKVVPYNSREPIDPIWDKAIEREIANAELRGAIIAFNENPLVRIASKTRV